MLAARPSYVLIAEGEVTDARRRWRFALHGTDTDETIAACDEEPDGGPERLELIALVRGLEALDQPSDVTLVTRSTSIARGVQRGLADWRNNHWRWERFGKLVPVRNADLWQRVDRALAFHEVRCRTWRFDVPASFDVPTKEASRSTVSHRRVPAPHFRRTPSGRQARFVDGQSDSPAMVIVSSGRSRRTVRFARDEPTPDLAAAAV